MAGVPFISVHVSRQLDNQPLQWKSIVLIGLYLLYNSPAGNPWWQIISAPVFDWCFDVSDLQGQTKELVEALLTEPNLALPRLTPAQSQTFCQTIRLQAAAQDRFGGLQPHTQATRHHHHREKCRRAVRRDSWLWRWLSVSTWRSHMPIQAWHNKSWIRYRATSPCLFPDQGKVVAVCHYNLQHVRCFLTSPSRAGRCLLLWLCKLRRSVKFQFTVNASGHFIRICNGAATAELAISSNLLFMKLKQRGGKGSTRQIKCESVLYWF